MVEPIAKRRPDEVLRILVTRTARGRRCMSRAEMRT
jgi:hypothetical protein